MIFESSPGGRLPLLSTRPDKERHCPLTGAKLYCFVTEAHRCEQLAQGYYTALSRSESNPQPNDHKSNAVLLCHCAISYNLQALISVLFFNKIVILVKISAVFIDILSTVFYCRHFSVNIPKN